MTQPASFAAIPASAMNGNGSQDSVMAAEAQRKAAFQATIDRLSDLGAEVLGAPIDATELQPVMATLIFQQAAGVIAAGTSRTAFSANLGEAGTTGLPVPPGVTKASASLFGGEIPNGQIILLRGFGVSIFASGASSSEVYRFLRNTSVTMDLRGTDVKMGSALEWGDILGSSAGQRNGRGTLGRRTVDWPTVLQPTDPFKMTLRVDRAVTTAVDITCHLHLMALRIRDQRVLGLS